MPNFLCFGKCDFDNYRKYGHTIDSAHFVGSLKGSYYKYHLKKDPIPIKYDICFISQYRTEIFSGKLRPDFFENSVKVHSLLKYYIEKYSLRACIACSSPNQDEYEYYKKKFGDNVIVIPNNSAGMSTYDAMNSSEVIITLYSTAALEAFGWGKKVLFFNLFDYEIAEFFHHGLCSIQTTDLEIVENKLNTLLQMPEKEYLLKTKNDREYMMNYDPHVPVNIYMRSIIEKIMKSH